MNKDELQLILEEGEGYRIEFKESMTSIDKELIAFANSSGGRIFLGITDNKKIKGVKITNKFKSQIQDIANNCQPPIKIILEEFENILIINVREGEDKPYKCSSGFYLRVGPNSQKLNRNEIIEFFKAEGLIRFGRRPNPLWRACKFKI
jgi:ATP-dependent DNA helicase RecG